MGSSKMAMLLPMWGLMLLWLAFVAVSGILAYQRWQKREGEIRKQLLYLWVGAAIVFIGDFLHTIAFTVSTYTGNPTGPIHILGGVFEFRTFAMFFDALVFMVYYALWALFVVSRYQQGKFAPYDKVILFLAVTAMALLLPGIVPNAFGIYTLDYNIAIWAPHIILFIIFGVMTVLKLISCSRYSFKQSSVTVIRTQERALSIAGIGFFFSFIFFTLFLFLTTLNREPGIFMILKTFAYMLSFFYIIKGFILPTSEPRLQQ
jgi:hypothetical protein